jgi:hypothetical protein
VQEVQEVIEGINMAKQAYESLTAAAQSDIIMKQTAQEQDAQATYVC